ncbi:hypothetical protein Pst134EB_006204 [Puccinia striiformis f. sp. tritici]|nr:hypothetical protein Pst134EB_006204 [Puccinia striiformis f. sp. tritici]
MDSKSKPSIRMAQLRSVISLVEQTRKLKTTTLYKWSREVSVYGFDSVAWIFSTNFTRARHFLSPKPMQSFSSLHRNKQNGYIYIYMYASMAHVIYSHLMALIKRP